MNQRFLLAALAGLAIVLSIHGVAGAQYRSYYYPREGRAAPDGPPGYYHGGPSGPCPNGCRDSLPPAPPPPQPACIRVVVPDAGAKVFIDGRPTGSTGISRLYGTPPFPSSTRYTYHVRAAWMEEGHEVALQQEVVLHSGETSVVDFTDAAAAIRAAARRAR